MRKIEFKIGELINGCKYINEVEATHSRRGVFECSCGKKFIAYQYQIKNGNTKSCGCLRRKGNRLKHGDNKVGDMNNLYSLWIAIKQRCYNPNRKQYSDYGGRGINVYSEWINDYSTFKKWILNNIGERPKGLTLDRINNDGNYEPNNLRWANRITQRQNRRK